MTISINEHFTPIKLLRFALPSIIMMIFMSLYTIVDGILVSRFVGSEALSSINIVYPIVSIVVALATMLGSGGNAIISKYLGEGNKKKANECLTQFVFIGVLFSVILAVITLMFLTPLSYFLGSNDVLLKDCNTYLAISIIFAPSCMLQALFQSYFVTASKPTLGLILTIGAGIANAVLDYVFIVFLHMGVAGAAIATGIGQSIPSLVGIIYFFFTKEDLRFVRFHFYIKEVLNACYNGSSEMISQLSGAVVTFLFNVILMRLAGSNGVAAITILMYFQFLFNAFHLGFSIGISPIIGFQYGAKKKKELRSVYKTSVAFICVSSLILYILSIVSANFLVGIFTQDKETYFLTMSAIKIYSLGYLFSGFNIMSSGIFTALSNGKVSAIISFGRTFVFTVFALIIFSLLFGIIGAWIAVPFAEGMTLILCLFFHYQYFIKQSDKNYF